MCCLSSVSSASLFSMCFLLSPLSNASSPEDGPLRRQSGHMQSIRLMKSLVGAWQQAPERSGVGPCWPRRKVGCDSRASVDLFRQDKASDVLTYLHNMPAVAYHRRESRRYRIFVSLTFLSRTTSAEISDIQIGLVYLLYTV